MFLSSMFLYLHNNACVVCVCPKVAMLLSFPREFECVSAVFGLPGWYFPVEGHVFFKEFDPCVKKCFLHLVFVCFCST